MTTKLLGLLLTLSIFCWEPSEAWVHQRKIIYITEFHILFHDGSILNRFNIPNTSSVVVLDRKKCATFYTTYKSNQKAAAQV